MTTETDGSTYIHIKYLNVLKYFFTIMGLSSPLEESYLRNLNASTSCNFYTTQKLSEEEIS